MLSLTQHLSNYTACRPVCLAGFWPLFPEGWGRVGLSLGGSYRLALSLSQWHGATAEKGLPCSPHSWVFWVQQTIPHSLLFARSSETSRTKGICCQVSFGSIYPCALKEGSTMVPEKNVFSTCSADAHATLRTYLLSGVSTPCSVLCIYLT